MPTGNKRERPAGADDAPAPPAPHSGDATIRPVQRNVVADAFLQAARRVAAMPNDAAAEPFPAQLRRAMTHTPSESGN